MNLKQFLNYCVNKKEYIYHTTVFEKNQDGIKLLQAKSKNTEMKTLDEN